MANTRSDRDWEAKVVWTWKNQQQQIGVGRAYRTCRDVAAKKTVVASRLRDGSAGISKTDYGTKTLCSNLMI